MTTCSCGTPVTIERCLVGTAEAQVAVCPWHGAVASLTPGVYLHAG